MTVAAVAAAIECCNQVHMVPSKRRSSAPRSCSRYPQPPVYMDANRVSRMWPTEWTGAGRSSTIWSGHRSDDVITITRTGRVLRMYMHTPYAAVVAVLYCDDANERLRFSNSNNNNNNTTRSQDYQNEPLNEHGFWRILQTLVTNGLHWNSNFKDIAIHKAYENIHRTKRTTEKFRLCITLSIIHYATDITQKIKIINV